MVPVDLIGDRTPAAPSLQSADPHAAIPTHGRFAGHLHFDASIAPVLRTEVDVAAYVRRGTARLPVDTDLLASQDPLEGELRLALAVLQRLEASALAESRAMLATATGNEARITAFLATWMVDRFWQARALRDLLTAEEPVGRSSADPVRASAPRPLHPPHPLHRLRRLHVDRLQPLLSPLWTALAGEDLAAGHMARMAIQESSLQAGLRIAAARTSGEAARVLGMLAARHQAAVDFFTAEAIARCTRSPREARIARLVLSLSSPLAGGGLPDPDLPEALDVLGRTAADRAGLHRARFEITRLLPGPDLWGPSFRSLPRIGA